MSQRAEPTFLEEAMVGSSIFSEDDRWLYTTALGDPTPPCFRCLGEGLPTVNEKTGDVLLGLFPNLSIVDANLLRPDLHPNCRCFLQRILWRTETITVYGKPRTIYRDVSTGRFISKPEGII